jgi:hypothetical protein
MSDSAGPEVSRQPLVAVICSTPILGEALSEALSGIAEVRTFPAHLGDTPGLLRWLEPDGVVVDTDEEAERASEFNRDAAAPLVHVSLRDERVRVLHGGAWEDVGNGDVSAEGIRNVLVGSMLRRAVVR